MTRKACRTTRHCVDHGWCHRCDPQFAALMSAVNKAIHTADPDDTHRAELYYAVGQVLADGGDRVDLVARLAEARHTNQELHRRVQTAESLVERFRKAVADWRSDGKGMYIPYPSLQKISRLAGGPDFDAPRFMRRFDNAAKAEQAFEGIHRLLDLWRELNAPDRPWWEDRLGELADVLAGQDSPSAPETLRSQVRTALGASPVSQAEAARRLGLSAKHMNQMLTGKAPLTLAWAEKILSLCGRKVEIRVVPTEEEEA